MIKIEKVRVYDLEESIAASKYPMLVDTHDATPEITSTVLSLARSPKGEGHDQFLTGIRVNFDLTCSNKMWVELERYRFLEFVSCQSTMHRAARFNLSNQCNKMVTPTIIAEIDRLQQEYLSNPTPDNFLRLVYNIPSGFQLTARLATCYRALKNVYSQRKNHKLDEWRDLCKWIETLPHSELITGEEK